MGQLGQCSCHAGAWQSLRLSPAVTHAKVEELGYPQAADPSRCFGAMTVRTVESVVCFERNGNPYKNKNDMLSGTNSTE